jgi:hypothetical protein
MLRYFLLFDQRTTLLVIQTALKQFARNYLFIIKTDRNQEAITQFDLF